MKPFFPCLVLIAILGLVACSTSTERSTTDVGPPTACPIVDAKQAPELLWENKGFSAPESVKFDPLKNRLYVSNVAGQPLARDGKGWISTVSLEGKMLRKKWASGLNAPKGMGLENGRLWVADIDRVVAFDTKTGRSTHTISVEGAQFLNDIAFLEGDTRVLVSDMFTGKIHTLGHNLSPSVLFEGPHLEFPNGLVSDGKEFLTLATWGPGTQPDFSTARPGRILTVDTLSGKTKPWTPGPIGNLDGIKLDGANGAIVSDWIAGKVFYVTRTGRCATLLEGLAGAADLEFILESRTLLVPVMGQNRVLAYRLPHQ